MTPRQKASVAAEPAINWPEIGEVPQPPAKHHQLALAPRLNQTANVYVTDAKLTNRIREIAIHIPWYGFKTQARLAQDSGVSSAAISRLIRHQSQPSLKISLRVTAALAMRLGKPLDVREVFTTNGTYPTPSVCHLTGCQSCLPPEAYDEHEHLKPEYSGLKAGMWSVIAPAKEVYGA